MIKISITLFFLLAGAFAAADDWTPDSADFKPAQEHQPSAFQKAIQEGVVMPENAENGRFLCEVEKGKRYSVNNKNGLRDCKAKGGSIVAATNDDFDYPDIKEYQRAKEAH